MKRIYNEFSAAAVDNKEAEHIRMIMTGAFQQIWDEVVADGYCPRDAESIAHSCLSCSFAENILRQAMKKSREQRKKLQNNP